MDQGKTLQGVLEKVDCALEKVGCALQKVDHVSKKIDHVVETVNFIKETAVTKNELKEEISKLATKEDLAKEVSKLATKQEISKLATKKEISKFMNKEDFAKEVAKLTTKEETISFEFRLEGKIEKMGDSLRQEISKMKNEIFTKIDGQLVQSDMMDTELSAVKSTTNRHERQIKKISKHLQLEV